ncbi:hypothetical protein [Shewanella xiamenensis]|uniref:hypothetical protein n=1 Tax=Shewanella xiamenensis TaxID=332186 RepID=UPI000DAF8F28|nr:hypothetical protein [Shewanella xiamenensis]MCT8864084.1 hypothetical protein [Shewanella xiamenensis]MCT8875846.1 hypothetical protein [Shewanella xiamenensis]PZP31509.1 MAG: hypothetical protein DI594_13530 [Shewanella oneidensis]
MKVIVVLILIVIGVFLFRRAQRLAKEEQEAMMTKKTTEMTKDTNSFPEVAESTPEVTPPVNNTPEDASATVKAPEIELMPREEEHQPSRAEIVAISEDIIDVDIPAVPNEDPVIILADASEKIEREAEIKPVSSEAEGLASPGSWANVTLQRAFEGYQSAETELARYNALQDVIAECYKQRKSTDYLAYGAALCELYLALFHRANATKPKQVELKTTGFMQLATLLNDTQAFNEAIALCQQAVSLGLTDGTVTGFEGRISRIEKAQAKAATA